MVDNRRLATRAALLELNEELLSNLLHQKANPAPFTPRDEAATNLRLIGTSCALQRRKLEE
jgi:hypothetical protein